MKKKTISFASDRDILDIAWSRNSYIESQSILILGAEIFALLNKEIYAVMGDVNFLIIKISAFLLIVSILLLTFSSFNFYNSKLSLSLLEDLQASDGDTEISSSAIAAKKSLKLFINLGKFGVLFWRLGISTALLAALIFLFKVGE